MVEYYFGIFSLWLVSGHVRKQPVDLRGMDKAEDQELKK